MSYVTGAAQRRGRLAATRGTRINHAALAPLPAEDILRQPPGQFRSTTKRRRTASIGEDGATGLVIHGQREMDTMEGTDPDSATPPISGYSLQNPDFPISYIGRGTLKFVSPLRIASIDGPLNVNGEVYSASGLLAPVAEVDSWTISVGGTGAGANFTEDAANTWSTYSRTRDHVTIHVHYAWSSKGSVTDGTAIVVKGIPYTVETQIHKTNAHFTGVTPLALGSYFVVEGLADATELGLGSISSSTGAAVAITGGVCAASGTISFVLSYHAVIP